MIKFKQFMEGSESWEAGYKRRVVKTTKPEHKDKVKAEVIFLTHNINKHLYNLENNLPGEELLWNSDIQEGKVSQYGGLNIRYKHDLKAQYIKEWTELHDKILPFNTIRYIFQI